MTRRECPRLWQVDADREGRLGAKDTESLKRHLRVCATCAAQMESDQRLRARALALHADEPNTLALRRLRARVLQDAAAGVPLSPFAVSWRRLSIATAVVLACGLGLTLVVRRSHPERAPLAAATTSKTRSPASEPPLPSSEAFAGTVAGEAAARWSQSRDRRQERIELDEGTIHVHVRPQEPGERFLVVMPDGELEVRGTTFDVTVRSGETTLVRVQSGVVELRLRGHPVALLGDGDAWTTALSAVSLMPPRASVSAGPVRATPAPPTEVDDGVSSYGSAMQRLRDGRYEEAAAAFHAFVTARPRSSQAEDASFLEAVALARAGRSDAAGLAAEHHLATFPASFHRREAAILEARAATLRGECDEARAVLAPWLGPSPDAEAVATMRGCAR